MVNTILLQCWSQRSSKAWCQTSFQLETMGRIFPHVVALMPCLGIVFNIDRLKSSVTALNTDPLLPALVEGLGLVHAVPVAKVTAVPVVTEVAILVSKVAKVATVTTSLLELLWERGRTMMTMSPPTNKTKNRSHDNRKKECHYQTHLVVMSPGSTAMHVGSASAASSAHVSSVHWATSVHVTPSGSHVTPHWSTPGRTAQAGDGATAPVEVATVMEPSPEGWGRQEATRWTVEAATGARGCKKIRSSTS